MLYIYREIENEGEGEGEGERERDAALGGTIRRALRLTSLCVCILCHTSESTVVTYCSRCVWKGGEGSWQLAPRIVHKQLFANIGSAVALLDSIRPYLNWQTTVEYLKDPPAEYAAKVQQPYDFEANFDRIYNNALSGSYANEYDFGFDLYRCFQVAHDGHFTFYPDSVTGVFAFGRTTPLVSVSVDGVSIPEVYVYADILAASLGNASFTPSPLTQVCYVGSSRGGSCLIWRTARVM